MNKSLINLQTIIYKHIDLYSDEGRELIHVDNGIFGASLLAFTNILKEKGFSLIAIDSSGTNAFFIDDVYAKHFEVLCPQKNFVSVGRFYNEDKKREIFKNIKESNLLIEV